MLVIGHAHLQTSHDSVVGFLRAAGSAIRCVRVRLSDASGLAVEEKIWFNDSTDAAALAEEVAQYIASGASVRSGLEATITVSD
jgi:hypothetical protein